jgi:serine/threonine protein kinase
VKDLFARAAELEGAAREAFLERNTAGDPELRARVDELLEADAEASTFLEGAPGGVDGIEGAASWLGRRIGAYEVVGELGRGGMGVVLLGQRADGRYRRRVALKVVPASLVQGQLLARFHVEVRILAELDHPNIARLLDAGDTPEGLAYLVMELVDGPRIDHWADDRSLGIRERLDLFRSVLEGIDYAHRRGVVHRDLKPSNILVTRDGVPKLVDFGIAKLLDAENGGASVAPHTRTALRVMTPEYASPEQVRGEVVDGRSDVYSLGVVLYRLLTGRAPYALDATEARAAERIICDRTPGRPSDAVTRTVPVVADATQPQPDPDLLARLRSSTLDRLRRSLRGDLDTIVLHALAKEPERRYPTAGAFADDIDRYLDGRPVRARRPGPIYKASRFLRRRRVAVTVAAAAVVGLSALTWQTRVADAQRRMARANSAELAGLVTSVIATLNTDMAGEDQGPTATRAAAVSAALASLNELADRVEGPPGPELLRALAQAYSEVGVVQGHPLSPSLGRLDEAQQSLETALDLWRRTAAADGGSLRARAETAATGVLLSDVYRFRGDQQAAGLALNDAEAVVDSLLAEGAADGFVLSAVSMVYERQGWQADGRGDLEVAVRYVNALSDLALRAAELAEEGPQRVGALEEVVLARSQEGYMLSKAGRSEEAVLANLAAVQLGDSLASLPGATRRMRDIQAGMWNQLGWRYNDADRPTEAAVAFTRALELTREMARADPHNTSLTVALGTYLEGRGQAHIRGEHWEQALADHRESLKLLTPTLEERPLNAFTVLQSHRQIGEALTRLGRYDEAAAAYATSLELAERMFRSDTAFAGARKVLALSHLSHALHHRLRAEATGDPSFCGPAEVADASGQAYWDWLRERGQLFVGEELIWSDFRDMMPEGACS